MPLNNAIITAAGFACNTIYQPAAFSDFDKAYQINDTVCGTALRDGVFYIAFQGTCNVAGWEADFDIESVMHPVFGAVHSGFFEHLANIRAMMAIPDAVPVVVCGHSKGAGEAVLFAALLKLDSLDVSAILFGCPNAGQKKFAAWCGKNLTALSFRNADSAGYGDPVPLVPPAPYIAPVKHTAINVGPSDTLNPLDWHSAALYLRGAYQYATSHE